MVLLPGSVPAPETKTKVIPGLRAASVRAAAAAMSTVMRR